MSIKRFLPDTFTLAIISTVLLASFFPAYGDGAQFFKTITYAAVMLLFFMHGAKLERSAIIAGLTNWRLHLLVFMCTFAMFPLLGLILKPALGSLVTPSLYLGVLYLCVLPSTIQSSIVFTSVARGNIPAAICSASASSVAGIFITPVLAGLLMKTNDHGNMGASALDGILNISRQLLLPFLLGQVLRPWIGSWIDSHRSVLKYVDQGSILLVIYTAFSASVIEGLWRQVPWHALLGLAVICAILLAIALLGTRTAARCFGFSKEDEIAIVFCGSKKGLASGVAMANVLFPVAMVGPILLPLMLFHQIQLMTCAVLARIYAKRPR